MAVRSIALPPTLYLDDEVAWLDLTVEAIREGRTADLDYANLAEHLSDMSIRERREVVSRLTILLAHLLKWEHQPGKRTGSWRSTIRTQGDDLRDTFAESRTLRNHAQDKLGLAYGRAVANASDETGLERSAFPAECPYSIEDVEAFETFID